MRYLWSGITRGITAALAIAAGGCAVTDLVDQSTPPTNNSQPDVIKSADGALAAYRGAVVQFTKAFGGETGMPYIIAAGLMTDELEASKRRLGSFNGTSSLDERLLPLEDGTQVGTDRVSVTNAVYKALQEVRGRTHEASGAIRKYAPSAPQAVIGHLYALEGYAEIFLADLFCSGIPLSTLDFEKDFTYKPGSTRAEVYNHAIAMFDTALVLAEDSADILNLARVGRGRAFLALGDFTSAAAAVAAVPTTFVYATRYTAEPLGSANYFVVHEGNAGLSEVGVSNVEGTNGLDYVAAADPRVPTSVPEGARTTYPDKYSSLGNTPIPVASGTEARLIEAEAALHAGDDVWLTILNDLRASSIGLDSLDDPITPADRVDMVFRERAFWLFLTGQRQGDLRRLVSVYKRPVGSVYPSGSFPGGTGLYGTDVTAPLPIEESYFNPLYKGCVNRNA